MAKNISGENTPRKGVVLIGAVGTFLESRRSVQQRFVSGHYIIDMRFSLYKFDSSMRVCVRARAVRALTPCCVAMRIDVGMDQQ